MRKAVEVDKAQIMIIDSLNGYLNSMPDERFLMLQMHELLSYLSQLGVLTILVLAQHGLVGPMDTPLDISYLSDAVLMLRYFEFDGIGSSCTFRREETQRKPRARDPRVQVVGGGRQARTSPQRIQRASSRERLSITARKLPC